jgi:hypothetical protein
MRQIYAELDEPDGLVGLATLRRNANLADIARTHSAAGRWDDALAGSSCLLLLLCCCFSVACSHAHSICMSLL